ncbi:transcription factor Tfb4 [Acrodontium crateriforme]|uniref:General transcription and DNA repair factor IIH subunit TFB4 n=1 Tax=Acrodontium crateriforme TaxID=150365 RepID=A0AAQ3MCU9_9PEZI|nr:transcription factor Tfb4 [Acrodontium crateriforme]
MNAVDGTDRAGAHNDAEPPSLLTIILDTNPHAWSLLADSLPLSQAIANLLVFINAHLAINHANKVAVVASHSERAEWLYPTPTQPGQEAADLNGTFEPEGNGTSGGVNGNLGGPVKPLDDANKYRPFAQLEHALLSNLRKLMDTTTVDAISSVPSTMMAGALTRALAYISKQTAAHPGATANSHFNYSDPSSIAGGNDLSANNGSGSATLGLTTRILIVSVSGDLADKYIEIMNSIFACQRLGISIDVLKLAGDTVFLQQAADTTGGIYMSLDANSRAGFLQYLMFAYLPDQTARNHLIVPGEQEGVDFRAACFCHKRVIDIGYVCSICLSIFCEPLADGNCLLCGSHLTMTNFGQRPAVIPKKKKKKKKTLEGSVGSPSSGHATPIPG